MTKDNKRSHPHVFSYNVQAQKKKDQVIELNKDVEEGKTWFSILSSI